MLGSVGKKLRAQDVAQEASASALVCGAGAGLGVEVKPLILHHLWFSQKNPVRIA